MSCQVRFSATLNGKEYVVKSLKCFTIISLVAHGWFVIHEPEDKNSDAEINNGI